MSTAEIIEQALHLKASERYALLELLHQSLDKPDPEIDRVWQEEALRRLKAYDEGRGAVRPGRRRSPTIWRTRKRPGFAPTWPRRRRCG